MKTKRLLPLLVASTMTGITAPTLLAQDSGRDIVGAALEAMGGEQRFRTAQTATFVMTVEQVMLGQARTPEEEGSGFRPGVYRVTVDLNSRKRAADVLPGPSAEEPVARLVRNEHEVFSHQLVQNVVQVIPDEAPLAPLWRAASFAPSILLAALDEGARLASRRMTAQAGDETNVVTYTASSGQEVTLEFDVASGHLVHASRTAEHPQFGDTRRTVTFSDYSGEGALVLPHRIVSSVGPYREAEGTVIRVDMSEAPADDVFDRPEGARVAPSPLPTGEAASTRVLELAPGVHQVLNVIPGYNALFVEQESGVVVLEAPGDETGTDSVRAAIERVAPGVPLTHHVVTHHHFDHTGGVWPYVRDNVTIVTTPGNVGFVEGLAEAPRARHGAPHGFSATVETVQGERTFGTGPNRIELIDVGPNPHAEEILVAYLPEYRLLYVADIYGYLPGSTPSPFLLSFAERLEALGLDIETIATAHTEPSSLEEFTAMVRGAGGAR
jgi:hypothetical protein